MNILVLDLGGLPRKWVSFEDAITYHAKKRVVWALGDTVAKFHGGIQKDGTKSYLESKSIIAVKGKGYELNTLGRVVLSNKALFARDHNMCGYCGNVLPPIKLSRDHVKPLSKEGEDTWNNCVTACIKCNTQKGDTLLEHSGLQLLFVPYEPNHYENLILQNRSILADQMEYLLGGVPKNSRLLQDKKLFCN